MAISNNIRNARKEKGYTQKQLAELAGIATITLQQYESGKRVPKVEQLVKLSTALQVSVDDLLEDTDSPILKVMKESNSPLYNEYKSYALSHSTDLDYIDVELVKQFHTLNEVGQKRIFQYVSELQKIKEYKKQ